LSPIPTYAKPTQNLVEETRFLAGFDRDRGSGIWTQPQNTGPCAT